jgi:N-acetylneuraminate synthase
MDGGPDAAFSAEPSEFADLVKQCRIAWESVGTVSYVTSAAAQPNRQFRRSIYVVSDISAGEEFTEKNIRSIRPGFGIAPKYLPNVLGRRALFDLKRGTPLSLKYVSLD